MSEAQLCERCNTVYPPESCRKADSVFLWCPKCDVPTIPLDVHERQVQRALLREAATMLERHEWHGQGDVGACPECRQEHGMGHAPDCEWAALLVRLNHSG